LRYNRLTLDVNPAAAQLDKAGELGPSNHMMYAKLNECLYLLLDYIRPLFGINTQYIPITVVL